MVYLALDQPEEALIHLREAMKLARQQGGIALGEVQRNRAKAYELLERFEEEYACLQEAVPLLSAAYGPEHPKAESARQRLTKLEALLANA